MKNTAAGHFIAIHSTTEHNPGLCFAIPNLATEGGRVVSFLLWVEKETK